MASFDSEGELFENSMEPEFMCVGLSPNGPESKSENPKRSDETVSIITRRSACLRRGMFPLTIPIESTPDSSGGIPDSSFKTADSGFVDVEMSESSMDSQASVFRRQFDSTSSWDEEVFESADELQHTHGSLPIAIPNHELNLQCHENTAGTLGLRGPFPYRSVDNAWNMFSRMGVPGSPRSLSHAIFQWGSKRNTSFSDAEAVQKPPSLLLANRRASESHLLRRTTPGPEFIQQRKLRFRSASGSNLPSPSRSIGTQTPTTEHRFVFPDPFDQFDALDETFSDYQYQDRRTLGAMTISDASNHHEIEDVGQQLRSIGDDFDKFGVTRFRSQSLVQLFKFGRRRSSAP